MDKGRKFATSGDKTMGNDWFVVDGGVFLSRSQPMRSFKELIAKVFESLIERVRSIIGEKVEEYLSKAQWNNHLRD